MPEFTIFVGVFAEFPILAVLAIAGIIFTALYVLRLLAKVLFGPADKKFDAYRDMRGAELVPLVLLGVALVGFGVFPHLLLGLISTGTEPLQPMLDQLSRIGFFLGGD